MEPTYYVNAPKKSHVPSPKVLYIAVGLAIAVVAASALMMGNKGPNLSSQVQHLSLRTTNLQSFVNDTKVTRNLKNQALERIVTDASFNLDSDANQLKTHITPLIPKDFSPEIINSEADTTSAEKIEQAGLNNRLDSVYAEILMNKTISLRALVVETASMTKDKAFYKTLAQIDKHLADQEKRLEAIKL